MTRRKRKQQTKPKPRSEPLTDPVVPAQPGTKPALTPDSQHIDPELLARVADLEGEIEKLKEKRKDGWDKFQILASLLIPASIALVGYFVSTATKEAEIQSAQRIADAKAESDKVIASRQQEVSLTQAKVSQAQLVHSYLQALTSAEAQTRKLAIEAILIALPKEGPRLVQIVARSDIDSDVQALASHALERRDLILLMFSDDVSQSNRAREQFIALGAANSVDLAVLMDSAISHSDNRNGVLNALQILKAYDWSASSEILSDVFEEMAEQLGTNDSDVSKLITDIRARNIQSADE